MGILILFNIKMLKTYISLSNINVRNTAPCYLKNYHYFFEKILKEGSDESTYNFARYKKYLDRYLYFFDIYKHKALIKKLIKEGKNDYEIFNEIISDMNPQYPDFDKFIGETIKSDNICITGKFNISKKYLYYDVKVIPSTCEYIVITGDVEGFRYGDKYLDGNCKGIFRISFEYKTYNELKFFEFIQYSLKQINMPLLYNMCNFFDKGAIDKGIINSKFLYDRSIKKNPLNLTILFYREKSRY